MWDEPLYLASPWRRVFLWRRTLVEEGELNQHGFGRGARWRRWCWAERREVIFAGEHHNRTYAQYRPCP